MKIEKAAVSIIEQQARTALPKLLTIVPGLEIRQVQLDAPTLSIPQSKEAFSEFHHYRPDFIVVVAMLSNEDAPASEKTVTTWQLVVEVAGQVNENKLHKVAAYTRHLPKAVPLLFVPHLDAEAIGFCRAAGVCCADATGNGWIVLGDRVYIERIGSKVARLPGTVRAIPSLSSPKTENVLRVLLNEVGAARRVWRLQSLAKAAGVSLGQAARVKKILEDMKTIEEQSDWRKVGGFRLTQPEEVLQEWAGYARSRSYRAGEEYFFHAIDPPPELQRMLTRKLPDFVRTRFALSGLQAAEAYAPYNLSPTFTAYIAPDAAGDIVDLDTITEAMDLDRTEEGINTILTIPRDPGVFYLPPDLRETAQEARLRKQNVPVVSPIQAYIDMQQAGARAREGAKYLLEQYLRSRWQQEVAADV